MKEERISYYTRKITSGSMTSIICTMYEIFFEYLDEGVVEGEIVLEPMRKASLVIRHLKDALNFDYEISNNLFALYDFAERMIAKAMYSNKTEPIEMAKKVMEELYEGFIEVDKQDQSGPAMKNSQQVTAGLTYGKNDLNEILDGDSNRGFLA